MKIQHATLQTRIFGPISFFRFSIEDLAREETRVLKIKNKMAMFRFFMILFS